MFKSAKLNLITAMLIFGTIGIFGRYISLPSSVIAAVRGIVGMLFLCLVVFIKKKPISKTDIKNNLLKLFFSGAAIGFNWVLLFEAYRYTTVATATLCYYLAPIIALLASSVLFKEKMGLRKIICVITALVGMMGVSGFLPNGKIPQNEIAGVLFGVGAAVFYATVILINKKIKDISPYDKTIVQLGIAGVVIAVYSLFTIEKAELLFDLKTIILLLVVGVIHTGVTYLMYFAAIPEIPVHTSAILSYIDPVTALFISFVVLREKATVYSLIGAVLVLGSTLLSEISFKKEK